MCVCACTKEKKTKKNSTKNSTYPCGELRLGCALGSKLLNGRQLR